MAGKEKYMIKVEGKLVEVTPEIYYAYLRTPLRKITSTGQIEQLFRRD